MVTDGADEHQAAVLVDADRQGPVQVARTAR
jgi:hypothetical protein